MNFTKPTVALLLATSALSACASGGGKDDDFISRPPIDNASFAVLEEKTGVRDGEEKQFEHAAVMLGSTGEQSIGKFSVSGSQLDGDDNFTPANVTSEFDSSGDGLLKSEHWQNDAVAQDRRTTEQTREENQGDFSGTITVGGEEALVNVVYPQGPNVDSSYVVYVPKDSDSNMYAGAIVDHTQGQGYHGVFGRRTTSDEMSTQNASATYSGVAMASVAQYNPNDLAPEGGLYEGDASGTVNFENRTLSINSTMNRDRLQTGGTDSVALSASGSFDTNGNINGSATFGGLPGQSGDLTGTLEGSFFGPDADTIGATFAGANGTRGGVDANSQIAGHTILNRD